MTICKALFPGRKRRPWLAAILPLVAALPLAATPAAEAPESRDPIARAPAEAGLRVYHLGHSLVGRDMPALLAQMAGTEHRHHSQLGWGASLKAHWSGRVAGFDQENAHDRFRPAREALQSGGYDAVVLTEMVEIRDAIAYHDSAAYLARWAGLARAANPEVRLYLFETWHRLDDPDGWLARLDRDLGRHWQGALLDGAAKRGAGPIGVIPGGQVLAAFVRAVEGGRGGPSVRRRDDLFARDATGATDQIHLNDLGAYLMALTHYAVLYRRSPEGLPHRLNRADGSAARAPDAATARLMQETAWRVVRAIPATGVAAR